MRRPRRPMIVRPDHALRPASAPAEVRLLETKILPSGLPIPSGFTAGPVQTSGIYYYQTLTDNAGRHLAAWTPGSGGGDFSAIVQANADGTPTDPTPTPDGNGDPVNTPPSLPPSGPNGPAFVPVSLPPYNTLGSVQSTTQDGVTYYYRQFSATVYDGYANSQHYNITGIVWQTTGSSGDASFYEMDQTS